MFRILLNTAFGLLLGFSLLIPAIAHDIRQMQSEVEDENNGLEESVEPQTPFRIVGVGDSLMAGYKLNIEQSFTAQLETELRHKGYNLVIVNAAVSGDTTTGGRERLEWSVPDDTNLVILELGANDMLRGIKPEVTRKNLDAMLASLKQRDIPVILVGMKAALNYGLEYASIFNPIYPTLAKKYHVVFYPLFLEGVVANPKYLLNDGMHPNAKGVGMMIKNFLPLIESELQRLGMEKQEE